MRRVELDAGDGVGNAGDSVTLTAPYTVVAGAGALITGIFGVAQDDITNAASGVFVTEGVFDLACLSTDTPAVGALIYWDDTNKRCTTTSTANTKIGAATTAKVTGATTVRVRLNGVI